MHTGTTNHEGPWSFPVCSDSILIGRDASCTLILSGIGISRFHAEISYVHKASSITALPNAIVIVNKQEIRETILAHGDIITIGVVNLLVTFEHGTLRLQKLPPPSDATQHNDVPPDEENPRPALHKRITIGRDASNTLCINHPLVSRFHATAEICGTTCTITDNHSTNGIYINGTRQKKAPISSTDIVLIGPRRFSFSHNDLAEVRDSDSVVISAQGLTLSRGKSVHVNNISCTIPKGEFIVLLGPSGAGKTSLIHALAALCPITSGSVFFNGLPYTHYANAFASRIGFVAQDTHLHEDLTVLETFLDQAHLRLPKDWSYAERLGRISELLEKLSLLNKKNTLVRKLSGGEKKRIHFGIELLSSPAVIFLDEPLAGLDCGLIARFMNLFREICNEGHTIVLTTHTLDKIEIADRIIFMQKGTIHYNGAPDGLTAALSVSSISEAYVQTNNPSSNPTVLFEANSTALSPMPPQGISRSRKSIAWHRQIAVLTHRNLLLFWRDIKGLLLLIGQPFFIILLLTFLYDTKAGYLPISFYFCLAVSTLWCGCANASNQIARQWAIYDREYRFGISAGPFAFVKITLGGMYALIQSSIFFLGSSAVFDVVPATFAVFSILFLSSFAGTLLGLCVSAQSPTLTVAAMILPIVFIPQIFFSGVLVPFDALPHAGSIIAQTTLIKPVFSLLKQTCILNTSIKNAPELVSLIWLSALLIIFLYGTLRLRKARTQR